MPSTSAACQAGPCLKPEPDLSVLWGTTLLPLVNTSRQTTSRRGHHEAGVLPLYPVADLKQVTLCERQESNRKRLPQFCKWHNAAEICQPSGLPCGLLTKLRIVNGAAPSSATGSRQADEQVTRQLPPQRVPRVIVQIGPSFHQSLKLHAEHMRSWWRLNPEYSYAFFNHTQASRFVYERATAEEQQAWRGLMVKASLADFFRVLYLKYQGGVYADLDEELGRPLRELVHPNASAIVDRTWQFECLLFSPQHPILIELAKTIVGNVLRQIELHRNQSAHRCLLPMTCVAGLTGPDPYHLSVVKVSRRSKCRVTNNHVLPGACQNASGPMGQLQHCEWDPPTYWSISSWGRSLNGVPAWNCNAYRHWDCRTMRVKTERKCNPFNAKAEHWSYRASRRKKVWFRVD